MWRLKPNAPTTTYLTADHLGSPRINTDGSGNVVARHDYMPFGEEISTSQRTSVVGYSGDSVRKQFTGYERDSETGLNFAESRYSSSSVGRFTSADSFTNATHVSDPQSWNLYSYVTNHPLSLTDPTGQKGTISWSTDRHGVLHVKLKASFVIYGAAGQNVSNDDLQKYKNLLVSGIRRDLTKQFTGIYGTNVSVTTDIKAKVASSEADAVGKADNLVEIGRGTIGDNPIVAGEAFHVENEKFDRMLLKMDDGPPSTLDPDPDASIGDTAAHEFAAHLLSGGHNPNEDEARTSLFAEDGSVSSNQFLPSDLVRLLTIQLVGSSLGPTESDAPGARPRLHVNPLASIGARGSSNRMANHTMARSEIPRWTMEVKH